MNLLDMVSKFTEITQQLTTSADLHDLLSLFARRMGFHFFALTQHVDVLRATSDIVRLHNYPDMWVEFFDRNGLGISDPVHRASHVTSIGFPWSQVRQMITLTAADNDVLALAEKQGIGNGYTVPAHVPGEVNGSVSFATARGHPLPTDMLPGAQLIGAFAFESARHLSGIRRLGGHPVLTDRQRDCTLLVARGKSDWEISRILNVSEETVVRHVKQARERYGVAKRTSLLIRTLFDGTISFTDVFRK